MIAGVAVSLAACASITPDNTNYVEDADIPVVEYKSPVVTGERTARIERAYNDSLRK